MKRVWADDYNELSPFEKLKLEQDGLDILEKLHEYKEGGFDSISPKERDLLKWAGVYVQRPRNEGYFMMRVKIPGGILNSKQARVLAKVAQNYGRGVIDLTTRQAIQFHGLTIENIPEVMNNLKKVHLETLEACGDCPRTVVGNPLSGVDPDETLDTREIVQQVFQYFQNNREFSNLPRKFKISISANIYNAGHAQINDVAFTPAVKKIGETEVFGFHAFVGGGLSTKPYLAKKLDLFIHPEEVLRVAIAVVTLFRDHGYRNNRQRARLKFLVADWGKDKFQEELLKLTGPLEASGLDLTRGWNAGYFDGVHPQKQHGLYYVGLSIPVGRLSPEDLIQIADCADHYGDGSIRTCNSKNLVLANIPEEKLEALQAEDIIRKFLPISQSFVRRIIPCTGKEFCNIALVETKKFALNLAQKLDERVELDTPLRIHVNGCHHSCGQMQIADIGLKGAIGKWQGETVEKFEVSIGGDLGLNAAFATPLQGAIRTRLVQDFIEEVVQFYITKRVHKESFRSFVQRLGLEPFQEILNVYID